MTALRAANGLHILHRLDEDVHTTRNGIDETRAILFGDYTRPLRTPLARAIDRFVIRHVAKISARERGLSASSASGQWALNACRACPSSWSR
jgi:hypothetical protein